LAAEKELGHNKPLKNTRFKTHTKENKAYVLVNKSGHVIIKL
jgi:hypothetical protein